MKPSFRPYSTFARSATAVSICQGCHELLARKALACNSARLAGREHLFRMCGIPRNRLLANKGQTRAPRTGRARPWKAILKIRPVRFRVQRVPQTEVQQMSAFGGSRRFREWTGHSLCDREFRRTLIRRERGNSGRFPIIIDE
jgi:hypothetical protein